MSQAGFNQSSASEQQFLPVERSGWPLWPWLLLLFGLGLVLVIRFGFSPRPEPIGEHHPSVGKSVTTFRLQPLTGDSRPTTEADLVDKVTVINFWGPWCGVCAVEFPHLVELVAHFRTEPRFQFFSISANANPHDDRDLAENTAAFLKEFNADFPTYRDPDGENVMSLMRDVGLENFGYPTTVVLGPGGVVRAMFTGYIPGEENDLRRAIERALLQASK